MNWVDPNEITFFEGMLSAYEDKSLSGEEFEKICRHYGVYRLRNDRERHMVRVKLPSGIVTPAMFQSLAKAAANYTAYQRVHLTTRQDIQFHHVKRGELADLFRVLAEGGMTTRESCGNTVRNITLCPYAGVSSTELFDVTPYALGLSAYFLRHPLVQNLPRKFKIAFEGCVEDHAALLIHDLGLKAVLNPENGSPGFQITMGGGLGSHPRLPILLEPFTPVVLLRPTVEAVLRVFDRLGNRAVRTKARLKFVIEQLGEAAARELILKERESILSGAGTNQEDLRIFEEEEPSEPLTVSGSEVSSKSAESFLLWEETNVHPQRQKGWFSVCVRCPLGDLTAVQLEGLAGIGRRFCRGIRVTLSQNLLLRWVRGSDRAPLYEALKNAGLHQPGAESLVDMTRCPGKDTCRLAITRSRGLAEALAEDLETKLPGLCREKNFSVKISGCLNSCAQHHLATVGLSGCALRAGEKHVPCYQLFFGGQDENGRPCLGESLLKLPARRVPEALTAFLKWLTGQKKEGESLAQVLKRISKAERRAFFEPFMKIPSWEEAPEFYRDWQDTDFFQVKQA